MGTVRTTLDDGILVVTLNRPEKLNAFNYAMSAELIAAFDRADADDAVRAVIVTGEGRGFCAGADLSSGTAVFDFDNRPDKVALGSPVRDDGTIDYGHDAVRDHAGRVSLRIMACLKPVIGAINGPAVGAGITMTLPMDIRLASETAKFAFPFVRRGIVPEAASSWFLPRIVGISRALEWCTTGRMIMAAEGLEAGLFHAVHAPDQLIDAAVQLAHTMCEGTSPVAVALTRQMLWRGMTMSDPMDAHRIDSRGIYVRGRTADAKEGISAFLEKRPPRFPDRVSRDMPDYFPWWEQLDFS
jgi:enoyl-CoA hydratase/carnithine racemase